MSALNTDVKSLCKKTRLWKLVFVCTAFVCVTARSFPQVADPSPTVTTATCGLATCTWNAFGPKTYTHPMGQPHEDGRHEGDGDDHSTIFTDTFVIQNTATQYKLHIIAEEQIRAEVVLNGQKIVDEDDFKKNHQREDETATIDKAIHLMSANLLQVRLHGRPGDHISISVIGVDNDPPSILETLAPPPNNFGWNNTNVEVIFGCADTTSGIASCPNQFLLTTEGLNQIAGGTAFDRAGNSARETIQISVDKTAPTVAASQSPAANAAGWNNSVVTVSFACADALSGVASCPSPVTVSSEGANQPVSGIAADKAGNSASASVSLNVDQTPPVVSISSPTNAVTVITASLQVTGAISDNLSGVASVSCNGSAAVISSGSFSCNVSLVGGANIIQVQAADQAGNIASTQIAVTFNATPPPPPKIILIVPNLVNMLVGDTRLVALIGDVGQAVAGAKWSISDPAIVRISSADPPQLTAVTQGTTTLTAIFNGLTAAMTINVLPGTVLPAGTPLWSFDPLPGNTITQLVPGNPVNPGDPDIFAVEAPNTLRAFTKDGLQLWAVPVGVSSGSATTPAALSALQPQNIFLAQPATDMRDRTESVVAMPAAVQDDLRKHGAFDSLNLMLLQRRFIEQQRRKAAPSVAAIASALASSLSSSLPSMGAATADVTTLLIKTVPDNSGGTIHLLETFSACCAITQASFIKIDNATQQQVWRHDFSSAVDENFAIGADDTIYSSQLIFTGTTNLFFGSSSISRIFALDGITGQEKFNLPLPPGHIKVTLTNPPAVVADLDVAARPGPLSILPDGSINAVVYTNHFTDTFKSFGFFSSNETAVSDHKTLQLLSIQPDGSFATKPIQAFDFDATACPAGCNDPEAGYIPNEVIPDGQGGLLAAWTGNDTQLGITSRSAALVRHFDSTGGTLDYIVPFPSSSWSRVGGDNPQSLVLGENNTAFGSDGQSIVTFDVNTGTQLWSFAPGNFQGSALFTAPAQGGVVATLLADFLGELDANPVSLLFFDSTGGLVQSPFNPAVASVIYFDANSVSLITADGKGQLMKVLTPIPLDEGNPWGLTNGNKPRHRNSNAPKLKISKVFTFVDNDGFTQTKNVPLIGIANEQTERIRISSDQAANAASSFSIRLSLQTDQGTTGSATFGDGTTEMAVRPTLDTPAIVQINGVVASSKADNISLIVKIGQRIIATQKFSVVSVSLSLRTSVLGAAPVSISEKNTKKATFKGIFGISTLGPFPFFGDMGCRVAVEYVGQVNPVDYKGQIILRRTVLNFSAWDGLQSITQITSNKDDTSNSNLRDDAPQSDAGKVYDLDAPGVVHVNVGHTFRTRQNFSEYAVLDDASNTIPASNHLSSFMRVSCTRTADGPAVATDVPNDDIAGLGCTPLTSDLHGSCP